MALCVCKCLNISLECEKVESNFEIGKLDLTSSEQRDIFFNETLLTCPVNVMKISIAQSALVGQKKVGNWTMHSCLACGQTLYAVTNNKSSGLGIALIIKSSQTAIEKVNSLKKSNNFSSVFNLLVPEINKDFEMKENIDINNFKFGDKKLWPSTQLISGLSKQLNQTLQSQLEAIEESVRQFRDQKYAEFEVYREKAQRDHKILASIISKCGNTESDGWPLDTSIDNGPPSPLLPPLQRRRLSSIKDTTKITQNVVKSMKILPPEEDSLEPEDLFDLEGMDSHNTVPSDLEDYDSDPDFSNDEGIQISRSRAAAADIARSLPISMPFTNERPIAKDLYDDESPQDIAASIKALARSVHGDVYELPRPRFSTQI